MSYIFVPLDKEHRIMNWLNTFNNDECVFMNPKENNDSMWKYACRVVKKYEAGKDIVIAWQFIYGVYIYMASRFYRKRVKIIALNFIEHSVGWKTKIKVLLYNRCFANKNFYTGINCIEYLKEYKNTIRFMMTEYLKCRTAISGQIFRSDRLISATVRYFAADLYAIGKFF